MGFLVLPAHSYQPPALCMGSQVADHEHSQNSQNTSISRDLKRDCDCSNGLPDAKEVITSIFSSFMELLILLLCLLPLVLGTKALWTVLVVITCALALRETLQMFASLKRYLLIIIIMISDSSFLLSSGTFSAWKTGWNFSYFLSLPFCSWLLMTHKTALVKYDDSDDHNNGDHKGHGHGDIIMIKTTMMLSSTSMLLITISISLRYIR